MIYNSLFQEFDDLIINTKSVHAELPIKNNIFSDSCARMYDLFTEEKFQINPKIPKGFYDFVNIIYKFHNTETAQNIGEPIQYELCEKKSVKENKKVLVGFSGGCDSCYLALNLRQKGYDVTLFHVDKLNPYAQPNEDNYSRKFAESCNFKYIEIKYKRNKHEAYRENPMKNQLIMGFMIDYCLENNISNIGLGSDYTQDLFKDSVVGLDATDSAQINQYFWKGVENYVEGLNLIFIEDSIKKVDRIKYIY